MVLIMKFSERDMNSADGNLYEVDGCWFNGRIMPLCECLTTISKNLKNDQRLTFLNPTQSLLKFKNVFQVNRTHSGYSSRKNIKLSRYHRDKQTTVSSMYLHERFF